MKRHVLIALGVGLVFLGNLALDDCFARGRGGFGGGRGGGASFGGAHRGGAEFRSPSMGSYSRPKPSHPAASRHSGTSSQRNTVTQRQAASAPKPSTRPAPRPSPGEVKQFLNLPQQPSAGRGSDLAKIGAGVAAGALGAEGARQFIEGGRRQAEGLKPSPLPTRPEGKPGPGNRPPVANRPNADQIRHNVQHRWDNAFTPHWWKDHPQLAKKYWDETGKNRWERHHWWRHCTWAAATGWLVGSAYAAGYAYQEPIIYDYGNNVYYDDESVYVQGQKVGTAQEYYDQAKEIASTAQTAQAAPEEDWLPLGVFALSQQNIPDTNMMIQLALSKEGVIKGTFYNTGTDSVRPIKGRVDKKTQRAAWMFADGKNSDIIMETGLYNLTQDQTEALVHFGNSKTQQWLMVRMNEPDNEKEQASTK